MSDNGTLDDRYLEWLYKQIAAVSNPNPIRSYWNLAKQLYTIEFVWLISNDDNREADGKCLRMEFMDDVHIDDRDTQWLELECSMLEMLIALARRASFEACGETIDWFWKMLENVGLRGYTDYMYANEPGVEETVYNVIQDIIDRKYKRNGEGGLFPLQHPHQDQRKVELWYQLSAYLLEGEYVDKNCP